LIEELRVEVARIDPLQAEVADGRQRCAALREGTDKLEAALKVARRELEDRDAALGVAAEERKRLQAATQQNHTLAARLVHTQQEADAQVNKLTAQLDKSTAAHSEEVAKSESLAQRLRSAQDRGRAAAAELQTNERDIAGLIKTIEALEASLRDLKKKDAASLRVVNESSERVADAELARDQAGERQRAALAEVTRLRERMSGDLDAVRASADERVARQFGAAKERESKLREEVSNLELACVEMEQQKTRSARDAATLRTQFDRLTKAARNEQQRLADELLAARASNAQAQHSQTAAMEQRMRIESRASQFGEHWAKERAELVGLPYTLLFCALFFSNLSSITYECTHFSPDTAYNFLRSPDGAVVCITAAR
jgi:chromosome segregation ATPase